MKEKDFLAWFGNQPASREFNYLDIKGCLFASFFNETRSAEGPFTCGGLNVRASDLVIFFPEWAVGFFDKNLKGLPARFTVSQVRDRMSITANSRT